MENVAKKIAILILIIFLFFIILNESEGFASAAALQDRDTRRQPIEGIQYGI